MNKESRKTRDFLLRLAALLLCCVCLVSVVSVSAIALEADASPVTEETTVPTEGTTETTAPEETTQPTDPDAEIMPISETEETAAPTETEETTVPEETETTAETEETVAPSEEAEQTDPTGETEETDPTEETEAQSEADALFERLMACKTYAELEAAIQSMTEEEMLLMEQFTEEQHIALEKRMQELSGSLAVTLRSQKVTIKQGETGNISTTYTVNKILNSSCTQPGVAVSGYNGRSYSVSVRSDVPAGSYLLNVTYEYTYTGFFVGTRTDSTSDEVTVTVESAIEEAQVYYLKTPTSDANSNGTDQWGRNIGNGTVKTVGATWTSNKNLFDPSSYVVSMPDGMVQQEDGSWLLPKNDDYSQDYTAIYEAYRDELQKELEVTLDSVDDIEAIYLTPYKISKNNGTTPDKHIDCKVSVKTKKFFTALFWVTLPDGTQNQVDAKNYKKGDSIVKTDNAPTGATTGDYPETIVENGVTYRFDGWYNEEGQKVADWAYTPTEKELEDGTVNFYARYVQKYAKLTIKKTVSGNMYNTNDKFEFTVKSDTVTQTYTLTKDQSVDIDVSIGSRVTITEKNSPGYIYSLVSVTPSNLSYTAQDRGIIFTMPSNNVSVVINNDKTVTVDTGVLLDSLPYVLILALVAVGAVLFVRKRRNRDDD